MNGIERIQRYKDAGFTDEELGNWTVNKYKEMSEAGFNQGEIDTYFGQPPFDPEPVHREVHRALTEATKPSTDGGQPTPVTSFTDALKAGFGESSLSLLMQKPTTTVAEDAPRSSRIASQVGTLAGDVPAMIGGFFAGGGPASPITGMAGSFATPALIRRVMMDKYEKGEVTSFPDFWDRFSGAFIDATKGYITGLATGAVGKAIGLAPIVSPTAKTAATLTGEVATMVTVGKALEGQVPELDDFIDTALALGFVKGSVKVATKLRQIYAETGVKPDEVAMDTVKDPTILHDLASESDAIPRTYQTITEPTVENLHALADKKGIAWDDAPAFMDFTEQITGKRKLDDLTPAERRTMEQALEEWVPDLAMGGGAPSKAVPTAPPSAQPKPSGTAQENVLSRLVLDDPKTEGFGLQDIYASVVDNLNPIKQALKAEKKESLDVSVNPYALERLTRGIAGKASEFLNAGAFDFKTYETKTRGYFKILDPIKDDLNGFRAYMLAKRALEKHGQGIETGIPLADAQEVVKQGAAKYQKIHEERIAYRNALLDTLQQSGILSAKAVEAMKDANKDYVPFYRFFEDEQGRPISSKHVKNPVKGMKGSEEKILDPIISDIKDTFLFVGLAEKNAARQAFVELGPDVAEKQKQPVHVTQLSEPEIERLFKEFVTIRKQTASTSTSTTTTTGGSGAPPTSKQTQQIVQRVREALLARGFQPGEADQMIRRVGEAESGKVGATTEKIIKEIETTTYVPELDIRLPHEAATILRAMQAPAKKDEIVVYKNGHRDIYKVDPKVAEAFNGLDAGPTSLLAKMAYAPASLLRAGVTITPDFIARNVMRDAISAFIYAGSNPIKTALGLKSIVTKDTAFHNWMKGGGANATMVAIDRNYLSQQLGKIDAETGLMRRAWNVAKTPLDLLRATSELIENATRVGAVRSELMQAKTKAQIQALSLIAREATVDFARHGKDTQGFARATAFFNPAVQGIDRFSREAIMHPVGMTAKALASVTLPSVLLWYANRDDKEIQDLPRWQKDLFWIVRVPLPNGGSFLMRIPKPQEFGIIFGTIPERLLDAFVADNPEALKDIERSVMDAFTPSMVPTAAVPVISQFANRNLFTGGGLIPTYLEGLMPEYQYTEYTSETAKAIGQLIGSFPGMEKAALSEKEPMIGGVARALTTPILIENYVRAWSGGMGMYLFQLADTGLRKAGVVPDPVLPASTLADIPFIKAFIVRYPSAQAQSIQDFYDSFAAKKRVYDTYQAKAKEGDMLAMERVQQFDPSAMVQLDDIRSTLTDQGKIIRLIYKNPNMTASDKRQIIDTLYYRMIELARYGNETLRHIDTTMKEPALAK